jgi:hypothetical protein
LAAGLFRMMVCAASGMMISVAGWNLDKDDGQGSADPCQIQFIVFLTTA